jgi:hypothetical protein
MTEMATRLLHKQAKHTKARKENYAYRVIDYFSTAFHYSTAGKQIDSKYYY